MLKIKLGCYSNYGRYPLDTFFLLPQSMVLVHHLRFYGTKRSSRHQDGTKDKDMTQTLSLKPSFHSTLLFNHTKHSHENKL